MSLQLPAGYFGYYANDRGQAGYDFRYKDLPEDAKAAFRNLKEQFEWSSGGGKEQYGDCYAIWPVHENAVLAARFRDTGGDANYDRPHTIRIETVLVSRNDLPRDWPSGLVRFLSDQAWSRTDTSDDPTRIPIDLSQEPHGISSEVRSALGGPGLSAVLFAPHPNVRAKGMFRVVQSPESVKTSSPDSLREPVSARETSMNRPDRSSAGTRSSLGWGKMAASLVIGLAAGYGGAYEARIQPLKDDVSKSNTMVEELKTSNEGLTNESKIILAAVDRLLKSDSKNASKVNDVKAAEAALESIGDQLSVIKPKAGMWDELIGMAKEISLKNHKFDAQSKPDKFRLALKDLYNFQVKSESKSNEISMISKIDDLLKNLETFFDDGIRVKDRKEVENKLQARLKEIQDLREQQGNTGNQGGILNGVIDSLKGFGP
jgi:hypothetical protein